MFQKKQNHSVNPNQPEVFLEISTYKKVTTDWVFNFLGNQH